jgi:hypothetical protein
MWIYVLYMGFALALDPFRLGFAVVLTSRRRPILNLFAFWLGGMAAGVGLATVVLLLLRDFTQTAMKHVMSVIDQVRSSVPILSGGGLQITFGLLLLLALAVIKVRERSRNRAPVVAGGGGTPAVPRAPRGPAAVLAWLAARTTQMLKSDYIWPVFVAGAASAIPPVDGVAMLAVLMASRANLATQFAAFFVFLVIMLLIVEIPLISYVVWPDRTERLVAQAQAWIQAHLRQIMQVILGLAGVTALAQGIARL